MGSPLSKLFTTPTKDLLEDLEKKIDKLEKYKESTQYRRRVLVPQLVTYSVMFYVIITFTFLILFYSVIEKGRIYYWIFVVLGPFLICGLNNSVQWVFLQEIRVTNSNLLELKNEKKSLLESAMEKGSYKEVKELLDTYDYEKMFETKAASESVPSSTSLQRSFADTEEVPEILIKP